MSILILTLSLNHCSSTDAINLGAAVFSGMEDKPNPMGAIKMLKKTGGGWESIDVGTEEFALVRNNPDYKLDENAFSNFINDEAFTKDLEKALNTESFAPSFDKFKEALIYANPIFSQTLQPLSNNSLEEFFTEEKASHTVLERCISLYSAIPIAIDGFFVAEQDVINHKISPFVICFLIYVFIEPLLDFNPHIG